MSERDDITQSIPGPFEVGEVDVNKYKLPPALYTYCEQVYTEMYKESRQVEEVPERMYVGALTRLVTKKCNLSVPYYTSVTRALKGMGCITQYRRGGGGSPSMWMLHFEPTPDLWWTFAATHPDLMPTSSGPSRLKEEVDQKTKDLNIRINDLQNKLDLAFAILEEAGLYADT